MPKLNLTDALVKKLPYAKGSQVLYWDSQLRRFGLRVGARRKSFICEKKHNGKSVRMTVGTFPEMFVQDARVRATKILMQLNDGVNPNDEKEVMRKSTISLSAVYDDYVNSRVLEANTLYAYSSAMILGYSDWQEMEIRLITKDMVEERHIKLTSERGNAQANKFTRTLRALFNFAMAKYEVGGKSVVSVNPVVRISETRSWNRVGRKTGHLKPHHLNAWFTEVERIDNTSIRDYIKFVLFTGARRREISGLKWEDVSMENRSFVIKDPKNHIDMELPMSNELTAIMARRHYLKKSDFVFPSPTSKSGHIEEPKKRVIAVGAAIGHHFTIHDLRRTFITFAESLDISHYALKALVNHKLSSSDVTAGYLQLSADRLREPVQRISTYITESAK